MKLDRNINGTGRGKYGLVNNRRLQKYVDRAAAACRDRSQYDIEVSVEAMKILKAVRLLEAFGIIDWGEQHTESEFFVIKLRDRYAAHALQAYAIISRFEDDEYGCDVHALADRAGPYSPFCKKPD